MNPRYTVFGVNPMDGDTLIENQTGSPRKAMVLAHINSVAGYKSRVWDTQRQRWVPQAVIDRFIHHLNRVPD